MKGASSGQDLIRVLVSVAVLLLAAAALAGLAAQHHSPSQTSGLSRFIPKPLQLAPSEPSATSAHGAGAPVAATHMQQQASAATVQSASYKASDALPQCPEWFQQYEAFHAAAKGKPGTKYLIHQVPEHKVGKSGGFGDRLRGMLYALRLAVASNRVLLFTWDRPVELNQLLVPSGSIDWTVDTVPEFSHEQQQKALVLRFMNGAYHPMVLDGRLANLTDQFVIVQTNQRMDAQCKGCPDLPELHPSTACVWNRLFRPTDQILQDAQQELLRLYNSSGPGYVAVHLRLGGFTGEAEHERGQGPLKNFAGAVRCARKLASQRNISTSTSILMVTDNQHLRTFLQQGHVPNVVAPATQPVHIDQALALDHNATAHRSTVVDMLLLGRAACLVTSPGYKHGGLSGFSHHGWLLGGAKQCHIDFRECI